MAGVLVVLGALVPAGVVVVALVLVPAGAVVVTLVVFVDSPQPLATSASATTRQIIRCDLDIRPRILRHLGVVVFHKWEDSMRSRAGFVSLVVVGLAFAGCGGTNKAASTATTRSAPVPSGPTEPPAKSLTYSVKLGPNAKAPRPRARALAAHRSGRALITIKGASDEICWKFSQIKNIEPPTEGAIVGHITGVGFLSAPIEGEGYTASGCLQKPRKLLNLIEENPHDLYVNIQNQKHPERGLIGRL